MDGRLLFFAFLGAAITYVILAVGLGQVEDGAASSLLVFALVLFGGLVIGPPP